MLVKEEFVNATEHYHWGEGEFFKPYTDNVGELYRTYQKEYGRCISSVFVDNPDGSVTKIGWVFLKRKKYDDCKDTYLLETWVTLHKEEPTVTTKYHYLELKG